MMINEKVVIFCAFKYTVIPQSITEMKFAATPHIVPVVLGLGVGVAANDGV